MGPEERRAGAGSDDDRPGEERGSLLHPALERVARLAVQGAGAWKAEVCLWEGGALRSAAHWAAPESDAAGGPERDAVPLSFDLLGRAGRPLGLLRVWRDRAERRSAHLQGVLEDLAALAASEVALAELREQTARERETRRRLAAKTAITRVLAESTTVEEAVEVVLPALSRGLGWEVAALWQVPEGETELRCMALWHEPALEGASFLARTRETAFARGSGLPGRVWESGEPVWLSDLARESDFVRATDAAVAGLRTGLAFPVPVAGEPFAVLEVFSRTLEEPDRELLEVLRSAGVQLGEVIRRRQAEQALRASEDRFRAFAESASDATFIIDSESRILEVNSAAERIFGYSREELLDMELPALMPARMRDRHRAGLARFTRTGRRTVPWDGVVLPGLRKDGTEVPLEITYGEYQRDGRHFFTGIARDITERLRQQSALERSAIELRSAVLELSARTEEAETARREAEEANRAKADFLAVMSHELRTPLNAILGYAELLLSGIPAPLPEALTTQVERIRVAGQHLLYLIEEVLSFSRIEAGREDLRVEEVDLVELVEEAAALARPLARDRELSLEVHVPDGPCLVSTDRGKVRQILFNLLSNAVKFTSQGEVALTAGVTNGEVVLEVRDTGMGIRPEDQERIFESFWQVERPETRSQGGTGLGLSVSRQLARMLGGDVTVRSRPGEGSTFTVQLPRRSPAPAARVGSEG